MIVEILVCIAYAITCMVTLFIMWQLDKEEKRRAKEIEKKLKELEKIIKERWLADTESKLLKYVKSDRFKRRLEE